MKVIIIEDELRTAEDLASMLNEIEPGLEITAILQTISAAIDWLNSNPMPDLIFSDIQLGDGLSFEIFKSIHVPAPIIFCTAFDEYAIQAFESNSIDYLLKPIDEAALRKSLDKYKSLKDHLLGDGNDYRSSMKRLLTSMSGTFKKNLLVHYKNNIVPVRISDVEFVYAANTLVYIYLPTASYPIQYTMEQFYDMVDPGVFFRANRRFIIKRDIVLNIEQYFGRKLLVNTRCKVPEKILISKQKASAFLKWMED